MAFSEIELKRIDHTVGALCRKRSPAHVKDKLRVKYQVKGHKVVIVERRPRWKNPTEWTESVVAKLKFVRTVHQWQLYWQRANLRWHGYEPFFSSKDLAELVQEIDRDPHGCLFQIVVPNRSAIVSV